MDPVWPAPQDKHVHNYVERGAAMPRNVAEKGGMVPAWAGGTKGKGSSVVCKNHMWQHEWRELAAQKGAIDQFQLYDLLFMLLSHFLYATGEDRRVGCSQKE